MNNYKTTYIINKNFASGCESEYYDNLEQAIKAFKICLHYDLLTPNHTLKRDNCSLYLEELRSPYSVEDLENIDDDELQDRIFDFINSDGTGVVYCVEYKEVNDFKWLESFFENEADTLDALIFENTKGDEFNHSQYDAEWLEDIRKAKATKNLVEYADDISKLDDKILTAFEEA